MPSYAKTSAEYAGESYPESLRDRPLNEIRKNVAKGSAFGKTELNVTQKFLNSISPKIEKARCVMQQALKAQISN